MSSEVHEEREFQTSAPLEKFETWEDMGLKKEMIDRIKNNGWAKPSPIQKIAIVPISQGKNILFQSQNGTGKTATFSIGTLARLRLTSKTTELIIISPTRELALQSEKTLKSLGANTRACIGGNSLGDDVKALRNGIHSISGTPGRILQLLREHNIEASKVKVVVLDEADEMLTSFKRQIMDILALVPNAQKVVVTATVSDDVVELETAHFRNALTITVPRDELTLTDINQFVVTVEKEEWKFDALIDIYQSIAIEKAIIFVNSVEKSEWLKGKMEASGFTVALIHGQMSMDERNKVTEDFRSGEARVLVATDVLSRGIDIRNITMVVNFDFAQTGDIYLHRIGRSGRFGRKGLAITLCAGKSDEMKLRKLEKYFSTKIKPLPSDLDSLFF